MERRRIIINRTERLMLVFTEPEAQDYWLRPGESVELRAEVATTEDDFDLEEHGEGITVWPSNEMGYIAVYAGAEELRCGHQRPVGWA